MGSGWNRGLVTGTVAVSCELYVDKVVKFIPGLLQLLLGVTIVILAHAEDMDCEEHKTFSFLVLFQAISLIFILLLWYWCYGQDLANHIQELIQHINHLTNQYKRYSDGMNRGGGHRDTSEATLHGDLDNYLEYLLHVLMVKSERLYSRHLLKWVTVLVVSLLWLIGLIILLVQCGLPVQLYMKVFWIIPVLILAGTIVLVIFHVTYDLCLSRNYESTFFYLAVPGAMDARLSRIITETYNPRYLWLLSRHCWQNAAVCSNAGLSKSLARKYCYVSNHNRHERWRDQHFPTLRSDQIEKFQFISEQYVHSGARDDGGCCHAVLWCGLDMPYQADRYWYAADSHQHRHFDKKTAKRTTGGRRKFNLSERQKVRAERSGHQIDGGDASSWSSLGFKPTLNVVVEDGYMTPNLFVRKLAKESPTPEQLLDKEIAQRQKAEENKILRPSPQDDLHVPSTGPQRFPPRKRELSAGRPGMSRDDTEVDYGAFYHPHHPDPQRMQREYDPLTYGVRLSVKKEMAKDVKVWRP